MTAQMSRERLEEIKNLASVGLYIKITNDELISLVDIALAGMDSDPVILYRERNPYNGMSTGWIELTQDEFDFIKENAGENAEFKTVYAAPPAPVAVPDECSFDLLDRNSKDSEMARLVGQVEGWNAFRAVMLKGDKQ